MLNGGEKAKAVAKMVTKHSNHEDGVANFLDELEENDFCVEI
jgi:hydroxymethylpyrimidine pyrophosphatase-like HAD family hydrolase